MKREYFKAIPAVYILFSKNREVLLLRRHNTTYFDGYFSLPAGHVELGESLRSAAIREAQEEVGVTIKVSNLKLVHVLNRPAGEKNGDTRLDFFFEVKLWTGELKNMEPNKCSELKWFNASSLPPEMIPEVRQAVELVLKGEVESEYGWPKT